MFYDKKNADIELKSLKPCKFLTGHYVIESFNIKRLARKPSYDTVLFDNKKSALYVIKSIQKNGIPEDLILI